MTGMIGYGADFAILEGEAYVSIGEILPDMTPAEQQKGIVETTHYKSPDRREEYRGAMINSGQWQATLHYVPAVSDKIESLLEEIEPVPCQVTWPNGVREQFGGILTSRGRAVPLKEKITQSVTIQVSGKATMLAAVA